jgi:hypothetical protein
MTNNNKTFFTIISFSSPRILKKSYNIIASSHYLSDVSVENRINTTALIERFRMFYDSTLKIVLINNEFTEFSSSKVGNSINDDITIFKLPENLFFDKKGLEEVLINNKNISQFIFIFKDKDYRDIVSNLALFNIIISGGSNTKKHILSPIQLRLARFLIAFLPLSGSTVANSFHSYRNNKTPGFDFTSKEGNEVLSHFTDNKIEVTDTKSTDSIVKPFNTKDLVKSKASDIISRNSRQDSINKREFHSISCLQTDKMSSNSVDLAPVDVKGLGKISNVDKDQRVSSSILSYLDSIKSIINNPEYTPEKAQSIIENT